MDCDFTTEELRKLDPFVVTLFHFYCGLRRYHHVWIFQTLTIQVVTLFHFYCGLRHTLSALPISKELTVVTLFHFYCGLRPFFHKCTALPFCVVTLFHFYCGLRHANSYNGTKCKQRSNPFPFLLWIATAFCLGHAG